MDRAAPGAAAFVQAQRAGGDRGHLGVWCTGGGRRCSRRAGRRERRAVGPAPVLEDQLRARAEAIGVLAGIAGEDVEPAPGVAAEAGEAEDPAAAGVAFGDPPLPYGPVRTRLVRCDDGPAGAGGALRARGGFRLRR